MHLSDYGFKNEREETTLPNPANLNANPIPDPISLMSRASYFLESVSDTDKTGVADDRISHTMVVIPMCAVLT